jgi:hypothetical protein
MQYFRSEEHLRKWAGYSPDKEGGIISLPDVVKAFSVDLFRRRMDADYVSHYQEYAAGFVAKLQEIGKRGPYWVR